jgi:hypothetical protein
MDTIVASSTGRVDIGWVAICSLKDCDFRDNRVEPDSYFDEADMNS